MHLLSLNPTFVEDFREFDRSISMPMFVMGFPRWLCPTAYKARDRVLQGLKNWHKFAHERSDCTELGSDDGDWDPYFGSRFMKERQSYCMRMDPMNADAVAAEDGRYDDLAQAAHELDSRAQHQVD